VIDNGHHSLEVGGCWRVAFRVGEPAPQSDGSQTTRCRLQGRRIGRIEITGQQRQQLIGIACMCRRLHKAGNRVATADVGQQRQHLGSDPIAHEPRIIVAWIGDGVEPQHRAQPEGFVPTKMENGMSATRSHGPQTRYSGTPQQVDQNGLCLVVGRVPGKCVGAEHRLTSFTGASLEIGTLFDIHPLSPEVSPKSSGGPFDHEGLSSRARPKTMVDVYSSGVQTGGAGQS
jgi:hypothetical protein